MNVLPRSFSRIMLCRAFAIFLLLAGTPPAFSQPASFYFEDVVAKRFFADPRWTFEKFCPVSGSVVAKRILQSYGSMFSAHESIPLPSACIQGGEAEVLRYQKNLKTSVSDIGGTRIELQQSAADALHKAIAEAAIQNLNITPLDGSIAGRRSYGDTLMLWNSRVFPAMEFWIKRGKLSAADRDELARLELNKKIEKILDWESQGVFFSTGRTRSILTSTAPPGASQHLAMIAFDVVEYGESAVRDVLNRNGWFQTIIDDPLHFTYLGLSENELPSRGLRPVWKGGHKYWVPNFSPQFGSQ